MFKIGSSVMKKWIESLDIEKISCVIPTYNRSEFLKKSLEQISTIATNEDCKAVLEIIVVDDGSNEFESAINKSICDSYRILDINYIKLEENSGTVSIPRNIGISHISGRTIAPVDDDCMCGFYKFECLYNALYYEYYDDVYVAFGNRMESSYKDGSITGVRQVSSRNQNPHEVGLDNGQFIYKADVYEFIKPVFAINACDWELYKQIANFGKFVYVDEIVCNYLWHNNNISILKPKPMRVNPYDVLDKYKKYFKDGPFKEVIFANN